MRAEAEIKYGTKVCRVRVGIEGDVVFVRTAVSVSLPLTVHSIKMH